MGPQIDFQALIQGKRLQACSDRARLLFPYLFMGANSLGRLELDVAAINDQILIAFNQPLTAAEFYSVIQEYRTHHLMFVYKSGKQLWGQWFVKEGYLPKYITRRDASTPEPPQDEFKKWLDSYKNAQISEIPAFFQEVPEIAANFGRGEERRGEEERGDEKRRKSKTPPTPSPEGDVDEAVDEPKKPVAINSKKSGISHEFEEEFWPIVWRKIAKGAARRAYRKARKSASKDKIIAAAVRQGPGILAFADESNTTPLHPSTWLNQERFDDEEPSGPANRARAAPEDDGLDWSFLEESSGSEGEQKHV